MQYDVLLLGLSPFVVLNAGLLWACLRMARAAAEMPFAYETGNGRSAPVPAAEARKGPAAVPHKADVKPVQATLETPSAPKRSAEVVDLMAAMKQSRDKAEAEAPPKRGRRGRGNTR